MRLPSYVASAAVSLPKVMAFESDLVKAGLVRNGVIADSVRSAIEDATGKLKSSLYSAEADQVSDMVRSAVDQSERDWLAQLAGCSEGGSRVEPILWPNLFGNDLGDTGAEELDDHEFDIPVASGRAKQVQRQLSFLVDAGNARRLHTRLQERGNWPQGKHSLNFPF